VSWRSEVVVGLNLAIVFGYACWRSTWTPIPNGSISNAPDFLHVLLCLFFFLKKNKVQAVLSVVYKTEGLGPPAPEGPRALHLLNREWVGFNRLCCTGFRPAALAASAHEITCSLFPFCFYLSKYIYHVTMLWLI
jgi:hypothetical protein